ncbi:uncharacterized protein P174DRAFT_463256 [Aspergillus novofumigatus IBT 16806]|uniref:Uncharacterized protein n=1 Tax=Aspergillus novofumigatus (strain IBT 16806) TaxID=1392255 RepID=A0A2I1C0F0_ASPN1|nr:uncharacterized protein P174DRAFT_463256 [Aspergillus novofumigatus IBT 16806]PKX91114.1 hypothetical protein P174DRAFT_463256 [Aspergillus novofumigatus IBT 16806]
MAGPLEALPTATILLRNATRALNPRIPPIARQSISILPCRIAIISRDKLRKESLAKNPDLRRCVAHNSLLRRSMEEAHHNIRRRMSSLYFEDDEDGTMGRRQRSEGLDRMASSSSSSQESDGKKPLVKYRRYYAPRLRVHRPAG